MTSPTWSARGLAAVVAAQTALANADGTVPPAAMPRWYVLQYRRNMLQIRVGRQASPPRLDGGRKPGNPPRTSSPDPKRTWRDSLAPSWFGAAS